MATKKARRKRAAHRANETRSGADALTRDLIKGGRVIAQLQARKRAALRNLVKLDERIATAKQTLKAAADAAVNDSARNVGTLGDGK